MAKVKDGKIVKDEKKEKTNFLGGKKPFSIKKGKTLKQQRSDIIKGRSDRLKSDAKKQGISVDELKKKRSDTFSTVLSPLTLAPIGRGLSLAGKVGSKVSKFLKGSDKDIILPGTDEKGADHLARKVVEMVAEQPFDFGVAQVQASVSVGVAAVLPQKPEQYRELLMSAESAVYMAKSSGGNRAEFITLES